MTLEEAARRVFIDLNDEKPYSEADVDQFVAKNLNVKLPLDGP